MLLLLFLQSAIIRDFFSPSCVLYIFAGCIHSHTDAHRRTYLYYCIVLYFNLFTRTGWLIHGMRFFFDINRWTSKSNSKIAFDNHSDYVPLRWKWKVGVRGREKKHTQNNNKTNSFSYFLFILLLCPVYGQCVCVLVKVYAVCDDFVY